MEGRAKKKKTRTKNHSSSSISFEFDQTTLLRRRGLTSTLSASNLPSELPPSTSNQPESGENPRRIYRRKRNLSLACCPRYFSVSPLATAYPRSFLSQSSTIPILLERDQLDVREISAEKRSGPSFSYAP